MNERKSLPSTWTIATVGDTGDYVNGLAFKETDWVTDGLPIIRIQNLTDSRKPFNRTQRVVEEAFLVDRGDILVSWSATLDAFLWDREPSVLNQHIFKVLPNERLVDKKFLFYLLRETIFEMKQSAHLHGSTMKHINRGPFLGFPVAIAPLNEQHRIVAEIETQLTRLDAAVASLGRTRANLKRYRAAVLKAACEGRLVPTEAELARAEGREYETAEQLLERLAVGKVQALSIQAPEQENVWVIANLPEGWSVASPSQLASFHRNALSIGPFGSNLKVSDYRDAGVPLVFVRNVRSGKFRDSDAHYVSEEKAHELASHVVQPGDILITKMGAPPGDACIYPRTEPVGIITADCIRFQTHPGLTVPQYFVYVINSDIGRRQFELLTRGVAQQKVSLARFKTLAIPLPPLVEQERIVAEVERRFSVLDEMEQTVVHGLKRAARLRQAILHRAFTGQLVPQDPDDEPASVLLDRIRAERAAAGNGKPTRKLRTRQGVRQPTLSGHE